VAGRRRFEMNGPKFCARSDKRCADGGGDSGHPTRMSHHHSRKEKRIEADEHQKNGLAVTTVVVTVLIVIALLIVRAMAG
jgi:hypothetical protein